MKFRVIKPVFAFGIVCLMTTTTAGLSQEMLELLEAVTPVYEENLRRAFTNEGIRQHGKSANYPLSDVLVTIGSDIIELRNLKLQSRPDFRVNQLQPDLKSLTLGVDLNLGSLRVEGEYEANNRTLQKLLPVTHFGKIAVTLENVVATGRIGLSIQEDSFVAENYDVDYLLQNVVIEVTYTTDESGVPVVNEIADRNIENTLANTFWPELKGKLTDLLHRQLGAVIVEDSVTELLEAEDQELRELSQQQVARANRLLDSLLCTAKGHIVADKTWALATPALDVVVRGRQQGQQLGVLETGEGYVQDLSTLTRVKDFSIYEDHEKVVVYGSINMRDFKHGYEKYTSSYMRTSVEGSARITVYRNKVFLKVALLKGADGYSAQLESVQLRTVDDIDLDISGLGSLSWLSKRIESWMVGKFRNEVVPILEKTITEAFQYAIKATDCTSLLS